jgi:hypothetical protein
MLWRNKKNLPVAESAGTDCGLEETIVTNEPIECVSGENILSVDGVPDARALFKSDEGESLAND